MADTHPSNPAHRSRDEHRGHDVHAVSLGLLAAVFAALLILTVITVAVVFVDLGPFNLFVALAIAVAKAALVVMFFMHLWWDSPFNTVATVAGLGFIALFLGITILDSVEYRPDVVEYERVHPRQVQLETLGAPEVGAEAPPEDDGQ